MKQMAVEPVSFSSPHYPYRKVIQGSNTLRGAEIVPYKILMYLLDLPDAAGYAPVDDNERPRVRLAKYLWYDEPNPLAQPLPTPQQKLSMLYDADNPDINTDDDKAKHPKGYRIFAQRMVNSSGIDANSMLKIYPGRILDDDDFRTVLGFQAEIWCNTNLITNTRTTAYDRCFDIEVCLREALAGVDIAGVGTIRFARQASSYNGSEILYTDGSLSGRMLYFSTNWSEGGGERIKAF